MRMRPLLMILAALAAFITIPACGTTTGTGSSVLAGGDAARGKAAISKYGCFACHTIPGVAGATAMIGPSLDHVATRQMLGGGRIPNTPENMLKWIQHPQEIDPKSPMPQLGVTDADAKDIAAYLYTLK